MMTGPQTILPSDDHFWQVSKPTEARARLLTALRLDLLGPESPDEVLREPPQTRYVTGMLAPFGTGLPDEEREKDVTDASDDEEPGTVDAGSPLSQAITPSSIGLSFLVRPETRTLVVRATWGEYRVEEAPEENLEDSVPANAPTKAPGDESVAGKSKSRRPRLIWVRTPHEPEPVTITLAPGEGIKPVDVSGGNLVLVEHLSKRIGNHLAVSVFLVNRRPRGDKLRPPVDRWIFQPSVRVRSIPDRSGFAPRELEPALPQSDRDRESSRLLFRDRREFATGHGCAAGWTHEHAGDHASEVYTELVPVYEVPRVDPRPVEGPSVDMNNLGEARSGAELEKLLMPLLEEYGRWIDERLASIAELSSDLQVLAKSHLDECAATLSRMRRGVELLVDDKDAFQAFRFANRAMLLQRAHTIWAKERARDPQRAPAAPRLEGAWRPFQLGFILLNLPGISDPGSEDRAIGDLLWFPTGGGKTEAYLGLAAYAMALRRRRTLAGMRTDVGLSVLMRYTLRLLTIQQFQRASTLLCACEVLRDAAPEDWGRYRFSLGLWLGAQGTPNTHEESRAALTLILKDPDREGMNPCQLKSCPWCGEPLTPDDYWVDGQALRTRVACPRRGCAFSKDKRSLGLPVVVVDEEIYRECPSMLIATVDKFAQMPWNGQVQSLFGFVNRECEKCGFLSAATAHARSHRTPRKPGTERSVRATERLAPPDLIIQDELHLISGPLGTLVGLYETAVDLLSSHWTLGRFVGPKVVASTATARRAFEQVQAVFQRQLKVFPPPGLEAGDSFFALEQPIEVDTPGRLFVGVCATGKSMKTAYIRVAASLLSSAAGLRSNPALAEPYTTLVSYFNSLRELGGAIRLMDDDIPARLQQLRTAGLPRRQRPVYEELTSRIRQEDVPDHLRRLEQRHDAPRSEKDPLPLDAVLASNMISVGVDIDRLGLMTVTGQPKTTAEYIQATSRVGRQASGPGLVVTIYNWSRPRDLSHYERFRHYHATLYRGVEAASATPFSSRALDRGLRGAYVAAVRLGSDDLSPEIAASRFAPEDPRVHRVIEAFRRRAEVVSGAPTAESIVEALRGLGDEWWGFGKRPLRYGWRSRDPSLMPPEDVLLRMPEGGRVGHWPAPQSLREVEEQSLVRVLDLHVK